MTRAQQRTAQRRAARAATERVSTDERDEDAGSEAAGSGAGSGDEEPTSQGAAETGSPKRSGRVGGIIKGLGRRLPFGKREGAGGTTASAGAPSVADSDDGEDDAEDEGGALVASKALKAAPRADEEETAGRLALGLAERVPPSFTPPSAQTLEALYVVPSSSPDSRAGRSGRRSFWGMSAATTLFAQPIAELADGLHIESMPHVSARMQHRHAERLGNEFAPASKVQRLAAGVVRRQADPVRHVRVRPSHPGMFASIDIARVPPSLHLVDAASRSSGTPHTLQISVGLVQLHDHPLFREEHTLQRRLRTLAEQLGELHQRETLYICRRRVTDLRQRLQPALARVGGGGRTAGGEAAAPETPRLRSLCAELLAARRERDENECAERLLARRMLQLWQLLKTERQQQGFVATRAKLQVRGPAELAPSPSPSRRVRPPPRPPLADRLRSRRLGARFGARLGPAGTAGARGRGSRGRARARDRGEAPPPQLAAGVAAGARSERRRRRCGRDGGGRGAV